jgi:hypothetical protein
MPLSEMDMHVLGWGLLFVPHCASTFAQLLAGRAKDGEAGTAAIRHRAGTRAGGLFSSSVACVWNSNPMWSVRWLNANKYGQKVILMR